MASWRLHRPTAKVCWGWVTVLFAQLFFSLSVGAISIDDLKELALAQQGAIDSLSFDCERRLVRHVSEPPDFCKGSDTRPWTAESYAAQSGMRFYRMTSGRGPEDVIASRVETWNGKYRKVLEPLTGKGAIEGELEEYYGWRQKKFAVEATPYDLMLLPNPEDGYHLVNMNLGRALDVRGMEIREETKVLDDSECLVVGTPKGSELWLDVGRGFIVKKYRRSLLGDVTAKQVYNDQFEEISPGQWVVTRGRIQFLGPDPSSDSEEEVLLTEVIFDYHNIKVNEPIPERVFDLEFPQGTFVRDTVAGIDYMIGEKTVAEALESRLSQVLGTETEPEYTDSVGEGAASMKPLAVRDKTAAMRSSGDRVRSFLPVLMLLFLVFIAGFLGVSIVRRLRA